MQGRKILLCKANRMILSISIICTASVFSLASWDFMVSLIEKYISRLPKCYNKYGNEGAALQASIPLQVNIRGSESKGRSVLIQHSQFRLHIRGGNWELDSHFFGRSPIWNITSTSYHNSCLCSCGCNNFKMQLGSEELKIFSESFGLFVCLFV